MLTSTNRNGQTERLTSTYEGPLCKAELGIKLERPKLTIQRTKYVQTNISVKIVNCRLYSF